jgi:hypothetical protein
VWIILKLDLIEIGLSAMDWIYLTENRDCWRALMKMVMNLQVLKMLGSF